MRKLPRRRDRARRSHHDNQGAAGPACPSPDAFESAPYGAHHFELKGDRSLILVGANRSSDLALGVDVSPSIGLPIEEAFPGLTGTSIPNEYRRVARTGVPARPRIVAYDHGLIHGEFEIFAFPTGPRRVTVFFRDVTELRAMEAARRSAEDRFRLVFERSAVGICVASPSGLIVDCNRTFCGFLDESRETLVGRRLEDFTDGSDGILKDLELSGRSSSSGKSKRSKRNKRSRIGKATGGDSVCLERRFRRRDGSLVWGRVSISVLPHDGQSYLVAMVEDITDRRRAEDALRRGERILTALLGRLPGMAYRCRNDEHWTMMFVSEGCSRLTGYAPADLVRNHRVSYEDLIHPDDRRMVRDEVERGVREATGFQVVYRIHTASGEEKWVWERGRLLHSAHGEAADLEGFITEVTDLKRAEAEMSRARDEALRATRAKSEFLANMSHELRTPLNGVTGMTGLLLETDLSESQKEYASTIRLSAEALLGLVNQILDFSKIEAGKLELEETEFDLSRVVEDAVDLLAEAARSKDLALVCRIAPEVPARVVGDPGRFRQVLVNLLGNAVKFTERGEVELRVEPTANDRDDAAARQGLHAGRIWIACRVRDTGPGIPTDAQPRIFEAFSQADSSTTRRHGGTGLGLAISRQLVECMGGSIGFESRGGKGATFHFRVPLKVPPHAAGHAWIRALPGLPRALVVLDNACEREAMASLLRDLGGEAEAVAADCVVVRSQVRAARASGRPYGLLVVDEEFLAGCSGGTLPFTEGGSAAAADSPADGSSDVESLLVLAVQSTARVGRPARVAAWAAAYGRFLRPVRPSALRRALDALLEDSAAPLSERQIEPEPPDPRPGEAAPEPDVAVDAIDPTDAPVSSGSSGSSVPSVSSGSSVPSVSSGSSVPSVPSDPSDPSDPTHPALPTRTLRVLVAEDNLINQRVAVLQLEKLGYRADVVADGREAVYALERIPYDMVLMDCQMPELDGYRATAEIRARTPHGARVPIIAMTANALQGDRERCLAAGMDDYIAKPFTREGLRQVLARWARTRPASGPGEGTQSASAWDREEEGPRASPGVPGLLDLQVLEGFVVADREAGLQFLGDLIARFSRDVAGRIGELRRAVAANDAAAVASIAHALRGSCASLGAAALAHVFSRIESAASAGDLRQAAELLVGAEQAFFDARRALTNWIRRAAA